MLCDSLVLAAGLGTRMKSDLPKTLHKLGGRPFVAWSVDACYAAVERAPFVVVGPEIDLYRQAQEEGSGSKELAAKMLNLSCRMNAWELGMPPCKLRSE